MSVAEGSFGIVLVSHSRALAQAAAELVRTLVNRPLRMEAAGGAGEDHAEFGTDALDISAAIEKLVSAGDVVVLMDMGSAILSTETALEFLAEEARSRVHLCAGPFIEAATVLAVQASIGASVSAALQEARSALSGKESHLEPPGQEENSQSIPKIAEESWSFTLANPDGLHARPATRLIQALASTSMDAEVSLVNLRNGRGPAQANSLTALASLDAQKGDRLEARAHGPQAAAAMAALKKLAAENFGDAISPTSPIEQKSNRAVPLPPGGLPLVPLVDGYAIGPLRKWESPPIKAVAAAAADTATESAKLEAAVAATRGRLIERREKIIAAGYSAEAEIFDTHLALLEDPSLVPQAKALLSDSGGSVQDAWRSVSSQAAERYAQLTDERLRARAADVADVTAQVAAELTGEKPLGNISFDSPSILLANDLLPSQVPLLEPSSVLGVILRGGGSTSHSTILLRTRGVPCVGGAGAALDASPDGAVVAMDGGRGQVWIQPDSAAEQALRTLQTAWRKERAMEQAHAHEIARTRDGRRIVVAANVGNIADAEAARAAGADEIGLLRTEFLFFQHDTEPSEEVQLTALGPLFAQGPSSAWTVRTLDAGGDKDIPFLRPPAEANPYLGLRALRLCLQHPEFFKTHIKAILRAAAEHPLKLMLPMVTNLAEVQTARALIEQCRAELAEAQIKAAAEVKIGIMVEVPSAALLASVFAPEVDFFSVGTNDLTQYTLAAERGHPGLAAFHDGLHPAVLHLIQSATAAAAAAGKPVAVCGELAADPAAVPVLLGLGVEELSVAPAAVGRIKATVRSFSLDSCRALATECLQAADAPAVRALAAAIG